MENLWLCAYRNYRILRKFTETTRQSDGFMNERLEKFITISRLLINILLIFCMFYFFIFEFPKLMETRMDCDKLIAENVRRVLNTQSITFLNVSLNKTLEP